MRFPRPTLQSGNDRRAPLQLLRYMTAIWNRTKTPKGKPDLPLTPIIPLIVHHGERKWSAAPRFHGLFSELHEKLRPLTPEFEYFLIDLGRIGTESLSADPRQRMFMTTLTLAWRRELLDQVFRLFVGQETVDILAILHYILSLHADLGREDIDRLLRRHEPERSGGIMNVFIQQIGDEYFGRGKAEGRVEGRAQGRAEGKAEGLAEGEAKGEAKGRAETLVKLLTLRFGKLPGDVEEHIRKASAETLERWTPRVINAGTLADVIGD